MGSENPVFSLSCFSVRAPRGARGCTGSDRGAGGWVLCPLCPTLLRPVLSGPQVPPSVKQGGVSTSSPGLLPALLLCDSQIVTMGASPLLLSPSLEAAKERGVNSPARNGGRDCPRETPAVCHTAPASDKRNPQIQRKGKSAGKRQASSAA